MGSVSQKGRWAVGLWREASGKAVCEIHLGTERVAEGRGRRYAVAVRRAAVALVKSVVEGRVSVRGLDFVDGVDEE